MPDKTRDLLNCCLYFTANSLARAVTRMAEEEFAATGLSPSHAFVLAQAAETPGVSQKEIARALDLAPSTVSRFVDHLAGKKLLEKKSDGRSRLVYPTDKGQALLPAIRGAWRALYDRYSEKLGYQAGDELTRAIDEARKKMEVK